MKNLLMIVVALLVMVSAPRAFGFGGCEEDCAKCHSLDKQEAEKILAKARLQDATISDIRMSPIRGLWSVSVDRKGKKDTLYFGFSKKHIMRGAILDVDTVAPANAKQPEARAADKKAAAPERYIDTSKIPFENALILGSRKAEHKVVVFTDPDCPYCAKLHGELKKVVAETDDIAFYLKLMPLKIHPDSHWKSQSIMCRNSLQLLEDNFEKKPIPRPDCEAKVVDETVRLSTELKISGTPTLVMPDGFVLFGGKDAKGLIELITAHARKK
jgi:thiol:disulfide interchange protein DsbC